MSKINNRVSMKIKISTIIAGTMLAVTSALPASAVISNTATQQNISIRQDVKIARRVTGSVGVNIDPVAAGIEIANAVKNSRNRSGFVKNLMNTAYYNIGKQKYHVMVFNLSQDHSSKLRGVKYYSSATYDSVTYGIWIFESGEFVNKGDGGWINWAFRGRFKRDRGYVKFHKPRKTTLPPRVNREVRVSDGNKKIIKKNGEFWVNGKQLGTGKWISSTRYVVFVKQWGNRWWIGDLVREGMLSTTVQSKSEIGSAKPSNLERYIK
jgi:hypothetical protein